MSKKIQKKQQQKSLGFTVDEKIPLIYVSDMDDQIAQLIEGILEGISTIGVQLVLTHSASPDIDHKIEKMVNRFPKNLAVLNSDESRLECFDIALLDNLTEKHLSELKEYSMVPIASQGAISVFDPIAEEGNGFIYDKKSQWSLFAALVRAMETYRFPYDWSTLVKSVKKS